MEPTISCKYELDTPCLTIDIDILEQNIQTMQEAAQTHKCSILAKKQIRAGAVGVCAAKISEAEMLVDEGIHEVLVTGPVVTAGKIERLVTILKKDPTVMVVVDHADNARMIDEALAVENLSMRVLLDIDVAKGRTGIQPEAALELAEQIIKYKHLQLKGIQAYVGFVQHIHSYDERKKASLECMQKAAGVFRKLKEIHSACTIFSGAGTGTYDIDVNIPEFTEMQVGSYTVMDSEYWNIGSKDDPECFSTFRPALTLLTTVVSVNQQEFVTVDAGLKSIYRHGGDPFVITREFTGLKYDWFGDEYGKLISEDGAKLPELGTVLELVTSHCDPTINQFDCFYITKGDKVIDKWPIDLRGKSQ
jgi:D-serine deaminase-like pyridoxal phosphate-dependent protein